MLKTVSDNIRSLSHPLYENLVCPGDNNELKVYLLQEDKSGEEEGILFCSRCERIWTVIEGIPRFVTDGNIDLFRDIEKLEQYRSIITSLDRTLFDRTISILKDWQDKVSKKWEYEEMRYWEDHYEKKLGSAGKRERAITFNRLLPRQRHILNLLASHHELKRVIEIGCGIAGTISGTPGFIQDRTYFGTDLSFNALRYAKRLLNGHFVLCDAMNLPFKNNFFDLMLGFGVMHHLPEHENSLQYLTGKVRNNGWMGFAEKIKTPDTIRLSKILKAIKRIVYKKGRSHDDLEYIDTHNLLSILERDCSEYRMHYEYSVIRDVMVMFMDLLGIRSRGLTMAVIKLDELVIHLLGNHVNIFAPKGILFVAEKR